jgi:kynurenine formamidase
LADSTISLKQWQVIDLTHPLTPDMPIWPGDPAVDITAWATYEKDRYLSHRISIGEHSGPHWGSPNTFIKGSRSAGMFNADELVIPAVVIDIRAIATRNNNYRLSIEDINEWEKQNGKISSGSMVVLLTGWQNRWKNSRAFLGLDDRQICHWPGFGIDAVTFLIHTRGIKGLGTDTHGVDPGNDKHFSASMAMYNADGMTLECLTNLDPLPATGSTLVIGGWPIVGGTGSPARVLAFIPPGKESTIRPESNDSE